jgi:hypothetical protein
VYPTHGFGSFCSATQPTGTSSTIGQQRQANPVLRLGEEEYVHELLADLDAFPAYYAHIGPANAAGPLGASVAASLLDAAGRAVVAVDDEYERAARAGLPLDGTLAHAAAP